MFFLCVLLLISTRAIHASKDQSCCCCCCCVCVYIKWMCIFLLYIIKSFFFICKVGVTREFKEKIGTDGWRDWGGSFWEDGQENNGEGNKNSGQGKGAKEIGEVHESVIEGWRDWGGSFWDDEKENIGGINKDGAHEKGAKEKDEDHGSGRDNIDGYNSGGLN
jgi:hypothetical protein